MNKININEATANSSFTRLFRYGKSEFKDLLVKISKNYFIHELIIDYGRSINSFLDIT